MTQGALFSVATIASRINESRDIRFNNVHLATRVEVDEGGAELEVMTASDFVSISRKIFARPEIRSTRMRVQSCERRSPEV
jgi:hypothetical protein